ncbi:hypothetical protein [Actinoplanes sp. TFC3]|uniref:hypothetical protein n=1 Tax=Actinoplanes sp. TFC3 TaxID=1710355 RepID=UPI001F3BE50C|nr:hypothetical protein [Actinoplanes sp. TFC3]
MGLFIIVLLTVATVLLIRNMNKRLRRLPDSFPDNRGVTRDAEATSVEAKLAQGDDTPKTRVAEGGRSSMDESRTDAEVAGVDSAEDRTKDGGRSDRS